MNELHGILCGGSVDVLQGFTRWLEPEELSMVPPRAGTHKALRYVHSTATVCENAERGLRRRMGYGEVLPPAVISPLPEVFRAAHPLDTPAQSPAQRTVDADGLGRN